MYSIRDYQVRSHSLTTSKDRRGVSFSLIHVSSVIVGLIIFAFYFYLILANPSSPLSTLAQLPSTSYALNHHAMVLGSGNAGSGTPFESWGRRAPEYRSYCGRCEWRCFDWDEGLPLGTVTLLHIECLFLCFCLVSDLIGDSCYVTILITITCGSYKL